MEEISRNSRDSSNYDSISDMRKTIEDLTSEKNSLLQANKALSSSVRDLNERIYSLEYDLEDKDEEIAQLRASDQEYKQQMTKYLEDVSHLNEWLSEYNDSMRALTNENQLLKEQNEVLQARVREYEKMVKEHEEEDRSLQHYTKKIDELSSTNKLLRDQTSSDHQLVLYLQKELQKALDQRNEMWTEKTNIEQSKKELEQYANGLETQLKEALSQLEEKNACPLEDELENALKQLNESKEHISQLEETLALLQHDSISTTESESESGDDSPIPVVEGLEETSPTPRPPLDSTPSLEMRPLVTPLFSTPLLSSLSFPSTQLIAPSINRLLNMIPDTILSVSSPSDECQWYTVTSNSCSDASLNDVFSPLESDSDLEDYPGFYKEYIHNLMVEKRKSSQSDMQHESMIDKSSDESSDHQHDSFDSLSCQQLIDILMNEFRRLFPDLEWNSSDLSSGLSDQIKAQNIPCTRWIQFILNYLYHYAVDSVKLGSISKPVHVVVNFDSEFILSLL